MYKILFVCLGNICRSPTAEGIMQKLITEQNLDSKFVVDSAGMSSYHIGDCPDFRAVSCALAHEVDIRHLRSRSLSAEDFMNFDLILCMDKDMADDVENRRPSGDKRYQRAKVELLLDYAPEYGSTVPDPYYHHGFDNVFAMIQTACIRLLKKLSSSQN